MEQDYRLAEGEYRFACLVWANEPLGSGQLVALANEALGWKKSTTYTVLKKLCARGILHNANGTVTALVKQAQVQQEESAAVVQKSFGGSLPRFVAAFLNTSSISEEEAAAIRAMLDQAPEPTLADDPAYAAALIQNDITVACYSLAQAHALSEAAVAAGGRVHIHLKADTGMGRIGFALRTDFDAAIREMLEACALPGLEMTGLFQHFSVADDTAPENVAYTAEQHALFVKAFHALKAAGREPALVHCDNSAGVMLHPDWPEGLPRERCMARPGIILYGYDPSDEVRFGRFKPVMTLKTVVSMIKEMQPGQCASYGRRFTAEKPTKVATLCTGYADGYPRLLSCGKGMVEIHGKACPVLGRVCMDQMMVDVTDIPEVREDDEAILWGGTVSDTAETIARKTNTIPYEVLCGVSRRVPRVYRDHGQIVAVEDWILEA